MLPSDPDILFSYCNTMLRDRYASLEELCEEEDVSREALEERLLAAGYRYDEARGRFVPA